ncbi:MAG TPA: DUF2269 family protein [Conexibacter sp.]|jgi:uncharacterized membrane protein|nr:DUF2269 family protein [Conexibacter sp.]
MPGHLDFYAVVLFVHIAAAVVAFGGMFAFPVIDATLRRADLRALPAWHDTQIQIGRKLITPGAIVVLIAGIYLVSDRWSDSGGAWISIAGVIVVVLLGLVHAYLIPQCRRLRDQAKADLAAGAAEQGKMSASYAALAAPAARVGALTGVLVLVALLLMVWKPGA